MQLRHLGLFTLTGLGAATTTCVPPFSTPTTLATTICIDYSQPCGNPPTATLWYGGCHDITVSTTYTAPPCPTGGSSVSDCTSTGTVCDDRFKVCGSPTPTTTINYGACHDNCVEVTYSEPACPTSTL
ncbi:hypothetical protein NUW58_g8853 [Xylaria curta]|uniref:Uncharacterized protein n=1 Tax=Xylaria curta TaxID=42375 RepID=A0ACC1N3B7_9PEZI|nr:hypothetical protein NUW58_g8853 [Xylaria curta]